jgi:hypothetical protein
MGDCRRAITGAGRAGANEKHPSIPRGSSVASLAATAITAKSIQVLRFSSVVAVSEPTVQTSSAVASATRTAPWVWSK